MAVELSLRKIRIVAARIDYNGVVCGSTFWAKDVFAELVE